MKFILQILFLSISMMASSQTIIHWDTEIQVTNGSTYGNIRPRISLNADDMPVVLFGKAPSGLLSSALFNGSTFDLPVSILPAGQDTYLSYWTGPDIAAKGDTIVIVYKAMPLDGGKVYAVRSTDGGITYSDTIRVDNHDTGVVWMPSLDIDENGNPSVIYMAHDASWVHPRYVVTHSIDQGQSFEPEMDIAYSIPNEACDCCPAEYIINGNQHALLYRNNENNIRDIYAVYSGDDGLTYNSFENIDQLSWAITSCPSTGPHGVFNNSKLYSVYASRASGAYRVYISETATNPSFVFENRTMLTPPTNVNGIQNYPRISNQNDTIIMVWQESETSNTEIFCSFTTNGDINELLNTKHMVNINTTGSQTNPDIIYKNGFAHLVYQDAFTGSVIYRKGIIGTAGLEENNINNVTVYPNPSNGNEFYINKNSVDEITEINMLNSTGKIVPIEIQNLPSKIQLSSPDLEAGIYFLRVNFNTGSQKTIKLTVN